MKILFLNAPPLRRFGIVGQIYPPLGILYLASYLKQNSNNFEIKAIDGYHEKNIDEVIKKIISFSPHILAVSFTTQAATGAYEVINQVKKKDQGIFVVAGGPHPTIYPQEALNRTQTDVVVVGEGEVTFSELANVLATHGDYSALRGIAFKRNNLIQINENRPLITDLNTILLFLFRLGTFWTSGCIRAIIIRKTVGILLIFPVEDVLTTAFIVLILFGNYKSPGSVYGALKT
jgi:radical SAM superfamily enzyme YgiQ (UPF0313 family)